MIDLIELTELNEKKILEFFEGRVKRSGHSLESRVENKLKQRNFSVQREAPFLDKDESIGRYTDLSAYAFVPDLDKFNQKEKHVVGQFIFVIECKNLPDHGWVFSESKYEGVNFPDKVSFADNMPTSIMKSDPTRFYVPVTSFPSLFCASAYEEYIRAGNYADNPKPKSNRQINNLYDAINKVIKATRFQIDTLRANLNTMLKLVTELERIVAFVVVQPLIVFEGHMYGSKLHRDDQVRLQHISYAQIRKRYVSSKYNEIQGMIHIVSYKALDEYLSLVQNHYWSSSPAIIRDQESLLSSLNQITRYFQNI